MSRLDQARVELDSCHSRHLDVSDQACGIVEAERCQKNRCRRESLDSVTQRPHESPHGPAKEFIVIDDCDQWCFGHSALRHSREAVPNTGDKYAVAPAWDLAVCAKKAAAASPEPLNLGLSRCPRRWVYFCAGRGSSTVIIVGDR